MENIEGILELDDEKEVMIISDENEMGQVRITFSPPKNSKLRKPSKRSGADSLHYFFFIFF